MNALNALETQLATLPNQIVEMILKKIFDNTPVESLHMFDYLTNSNSTSRYRRQIIEIFNNVHIFALMETRIWIRVLFTMGYNFATNNFNPRNRNFPWNQNMIDYQTRITQNGLYTSRVHDLLEISNNLSY